MKFDYDSKEMEEPDKHVYVRKEMLIQIAMGWGFHTGETYHKGVSGSQIKSLDFVLKF